MNDGKKKKPQKHQNKTAFKITFDPLSLEIHKKVSLSLLCKRCAQQISWKLQFNKYKKITQPSKCNYCHDKVVVRSYMRSCDPCAQREGVCPKCLNKDVEMPEEDKVKLSAKEQVEKDKQDLKAKQEYFDSLRERSKRKVLREQEKGIIQWDTSSKCFVDKEGNQVEGLKFKSKGLDDLQKQLQDDEDDDEKQSKSEKGNQEEEKLMELRNKGKKNKNNQDDEEEEQENDEDWESQQSDNKSSRSDKKDSKTKDRKEDKTGKAENKQEDPSIEQDQLLEQRDVPDIEQE